VTVNRRLMAEVTVISVKKQKKEVYFSPEKTEKITTF